MGLMSKPDMSSNDGRQDESEERIDNQPGGSSPSPLELTKGHGDSDTGVLGPNSGRGASSEVTGADHRPSSFSESQFGLDAKTVSYGHAAAGSRNVNSHADVDGFCVSRPLCSTERNAGGDGCNLDNTTSTHGVKKHGLINKIKEKLPGHHHTAGRVIENDPPKKARWIR